MEIREDARVCEALRPVGRAAGCGGQALDAGAARTARGLRPLWRAPLLALGLVGLVAGVGAGLARVAYRMPDVVSSASAWHGPLMVGGFFGVVIALERAIAIGRRWAYLGPLAGGLGAVAILAGKPSWGAALLAAGSVVLLAASIDVLRRQRALSSLTLALGGACWLVGNLMWLLGVAMDGVVAWWLAFLILTIAGERLEPSRLLPPSPAARGTFVAILVVIGCGLIAVPRPSGPPTLALGLVALSVWLLRQDVARRSVRRPGLARFSAVCLLSGYAWLAVGAATMLGGGLAVGTRSYDAAVHAFTLGFVFSMVFGHAPVIVPAVLRIALPYRRTFYMPWMLLQGSLVVRLTGDAADRFDWTRVGALLNAFALVAFIVVMLGTVLRARAGEAARARAAPADLPDPHRDRGSGAVTPTPDR